MTKQTPGKILNIFYYGIAIILIYFYNLFQATNKGVFCSYICIDFLLCLLFIDSILFIEHLFYDYLFSKKIKFINIACLWLPVINAPGG